jgi:hypothetical protein
MPLSAPTSRHRAGLYQVAHLEKDI